VRQALSNRIIPKESLSQLRRAELGDLAGPNPRTRPVQARSEAPAAPDPSLLALAREEGHREGLEQGRREAEALLDAERAALGELSNGLALLMNDFEQSLATDVLSLSLELAKLIVRHSVKVKPDLVLSVLREAVSSLPGVDQQTTIHLHPSDASLLRNLAENDKTFRELPWKIVEDMHVERGGCRLDTATTEVDATLETRWRRIIGALGSDDPWIDITT
jgi:flagellar assembly protein FliH